MKILVVGTERDFEEFENKFGIDHDLTLDKRYQFQSTFASFDLVFDFFIGDDPELFNNYIGLEGVRLFINIPKISLLELSYFQNHEFDIKIFGFNGLPTFTDRSLLEVSLLNDQYKDELTAICASLKTDFQIVKDRVGMITPRIICMIINEAFYTVQEGTASPEDIDQGMKLGTNYPYGPFEWSLKIGIKNVYELLEAIYDDTKDERYKICPALKQAYLKL
ncbi:3-hydroxyacyl-CoA dehydrogenase family protein [Roseivirga misakiensis]|uniref:3-hydroxyacyl-CoA dehydrogenase n=1 Tax=Roseivirga misakiensis TaxID=1563681 RepID=A0A1E5T3G0_9BACT|nr:3-hydroxyacyl-CoA dehydrogenase family protein [Roseivirga misakiensis]OEK05910.1 3-hydroxyacyl-CoA dehydrogenase [Roseivirga misakiensis]